jgi:tetratricopeptide (TPR) repeat protein
MQFAKLLKYKLKYLDELFPIAHNLFREKRYSDALKYYELIHENISQRNDIFIKMAQCYVYCDDMNKAEKFFKMAIEANPRGAYLYAKFSIVLSSRKSTQKRARDVAEEAGRIYKQYGNTKTWELAEVKYAQAKSLRSNDPRKAQILYEEVCQLEETNSYYLCMFSKFLFENHQPDYGKSILDKAKNVNAKYHLYIRFYEKYVRKNTNFETITEITDVDEDTCEEDLEIDN